MFISVLQQTVWLCLVKRNVVHGCGNLPSDLSPVIDACEHGLLARYPRPRYRVGFSAKLMSILALLPEFIGDWLLAKRLQSTWYYLSDWLYKWNQSSTVNTTACSSASTTTIITATGLLLLLVHTLCVITYHHVQNDDAWRTSKQLSAIIQAWHLSLFGHIARLPDEADAKMVLFAV